MRRQIVLLISAIIFVSVFYQWLSAVPSPFLEDDSHFYAQVAYNIGTGHGSTFDGIHHTDGYHLAWCWILSLTSAVVSAITLNKDIHLAAYMIIYLFLVASVAVEFGQTLAEKLFLCAAMLWSAWLMESALLCFVLLLVIRWLYSDHKTWPWIALAVPFVRVDACIILLVWSLCLFYIGFRIPALRLAVLAIVGAVLQLIMMKLLHGHWTSVSSELKATTPSLSNLLHGIVSRRMLIIILIFALTSVWAYIQSRYIEQIILVGAISFIIVHMTANNDIKSWYLAPVLILTIFVMFRVVPDIRLRLLSRAAYVACVLIVVTRIYYSVVCWHDAVKVRQFIVELQQEVPQNAIVFSTDGAGYLGYHSERHIINGDGLINSHEYAHRLRTAGLTKYLYEENVDYVISNIPGTLAHAVALYGGMQAPQASRLVFHIETIDIPWRFSLYNIRAN